MLNNSFLIKYKTESDKFFITICFIIIYGTEVTLSAKKYAFSAGVLLPLRQPCPDSL